MQRDAQVGIALAYQADEPLDRGRRRPGHGIGQGKLLDLDVVLSRKLKYLTDEIDHAMRRNFALEVATERGHDPSTLNGNPLGLVVADADLLRGKVFSHCAALVAFEKGL